MKEKKLFVDMDGTIVKWQTAASMDDLMKEGFFISGVPHNSVIEAVTELRNDADVAVLSAYLAESPFAKNEKNEWLDIYADGMADSRFFVPTYNKVAPKDVKIVFVEQALGRPLRKTDILLDDYSVNLHAWEKAGGTAVKVRNGVNGTHGTWKGAYIRANDSADNIAAKIREICTGVSNTPA